MPTPDARPVGETAEPSPPEYADLCIFLGDCGLTGGQQHRAIELVNAMLRTQTDTARAALLAGVPTVWVGWDKPDHQLLHLFIREPTCLRTPSEDAWFEARGESGESVELPLYFGAALGLAPGTVRRYALVPIEEETPT